MCAIAILMNIINIEYVQSKLPFVIFNVNLWFFNRIMPARKLPSILFIGVGDFDKHLKHLTSACIHKKESMCVSVCKCVCLVKQLS